MKELKFKQRLSDYKTELLTTALYIKYLYIFSLYQEEIKSVKLENSDMREE